MGIDSYQDGSEHKTVKVQRIQLVCCILELECLQILHAHDQAARAASTIRCNAFDVLPAI
jgi:hypothetical protein